MLYFNHQKQKHSNERNTGGMAMSVLNITKDNFQKEIIESEKTVLLDFWAGWCGPCRMLSPIVDEIAGEREDIKVAKINVDEQQELAAAFQVMSIPTLVVMKDGKIVSKTMGVRPKKQVLSLLP
ncbi:thioredoxin [Frisingicoccus sp.]|uniref:thioredoxin n=2 Tax=Frisingicoccus sp. TaxID=1918627 RepID=UPI003AB517DC